MMVVGAPARAWRSARSRCGFNSSVMPAYGIVQALRKGTETIRQEIESIGRAGAGRVDYLGGIGADALATQLQPKPTPRRAYP